MPFEACLAPEVKPFHLFARTNAELHLHLLEFPHAEDELAGDDFIAERFAYLRYSEGKTHTTCFLHVQVIHENTLGCLRTEVNFHGAVCCRAHLGLEHEVELAHVRPVARSADRIYYLVVKDDLAQLVEIVGVHGVGETLMQLIAFLLMLENAGIGLAEHSLVEAVAETFGGFCNLFVD